MSASANRSRARGAYFSYYINGTMTSLYDAYKSFSPAKVQAWDYCRRLCYERGGHGLKVLTANTFRFTAGFTFEDRETGECKFMYITPNYNTEISIPDWLS